MRTGGLVVVGVLLAVLYVLNRKDVEVVSMKPFAVRPISASGGELSGVIVLNNPNLLSSTIKTVHEKFYLNGILLGILDNEISQGIPGMKETEFPVSIRFSNSDYQKGLDADAEHHSDTIVMVSGDIEFQNLFKSGKAEVKQSAVIKHEKP
jgi:LEA14-like dessication related protein